jgi:hypothetical protein
MKGGVCETLREVAEAIREGEPSSLALGNFMAFLKPNQVERALEEAPALLALRGRGRLPGRRGGAAGTAARHSSPRCQATPVPDVT